MEIAYACGNKHSKSRMGKSAQKEQNRGNHHGIILAHGIEKGPVVLKARGIEGSWYCFGTWY